MIYFFEMDDGDGGPSGSGASAALRHRRPVENWPRPEEAEPTLTPPSPESTLEAVTAPATGQPSATESSGPAANEGSPAPPSFAASFSMAVLAGLAANSSFGVLSKADPGCSHFVTLLQQLFSLFATYKTAGKFAHNGTSGLMIPSGYHVASSLCVIVACTLGNLSLDLGLPLPLFFLIKCGNLVASMLVGFVIMGKHYHARQVVSVSLITLGLVLSTVKGNPKGGASTGEDPPSSAGRVILGAGVLFAALVSNSLLGVVQEAAFRTYGNHFEELTFMSTLAFLPLYLGINHDAITSHAAAWFGGSLGSAVWIPLAVNMLSNHICRIAMCRLSSSSLGSLAAMFATTAFRFLSIIVAALLETVASSNRSTLSDIWGGIALVLVGSALSLTPPKPAPSQQPTSSSSSSAGKDDADATIVASDVVDNSSDGDEDAVDMDGDDEEENISDDGPADTFAGDARIPPPPLKNPSPQTRKRRSASYSTPGSGPDGRHILRQYASIRWSTSGRNLAGFGYPVPSASPARGGGLKKILSVELLESWGGESPSPSDLRKSWSSRSLALLNPSGAPPPETRPRRGSTGDLGPGSEGPER